MYAEGTFITLLVFIEKLGLFQSQENPGPAIFEMLRVQISRAASVERFRCQKISWLQTRPARDALLDPPGYFSLSKRRPISCGSEVGSLQI
jgi:hypothetical protein